MGVSILLLAMLGMAIAGNQDRFSSFGNNNTDEIVVTKDYDGDEEYDYYRDDYKDFEYPDNCDQDMTVYDQEGLSCKHTSFTGLAPIDQIQEFSNTKPKLCCPPHKYLFKDQCEKRTATFKREVCGSPNTFPVRSHHSNIHCPLDCKLTDVAKSDFQLQLDGTLTIIGTF